MSNYRKTMASALQEMYPLDESVIDKVKEIDSKKSAAKIDGVMVDSFTASAISQEDGKTSHYQTCKFSNEDDAEE
jgi:hypothetical protein